MILRWNSRIVVLSILLSCLFWKGCDGSDVETPPIPVKPEAPEIVLENTITTDALFDHVQTFEDISLSHDLSRNSVSPGYARSMNYIEDVLADSGLLISEQEFEYRVFMETETATLEMMSPKHETFGRGKDFYTMTYSGIGRASGEIAFVKPMFPPGDEPDTSSDGCESADFDHVDLTGKIAVIQRGTCEFIIKAYNAELRGAVAVLIFNEGQEDRTGPIVGTLGEHFKMDIPVLGISYAFGEELYDLAASGERPSLEVSVKGINTTAQACNLFAETPYGNEKQVVMMGAHLDSVIQGPGINDNASGAAAILEIAYQTGIRPYIPENKIRFAWWAAEEEGCIGSYHYLDAIEPGDMRNIALYLNFDSIASHNFVRGVEDGDLSNTLMDPRNVYLETPDGCGAVEQVFLEYFASKRLPVKPTPLTGFTDYQPFAEYGIPFGGLFTGLGGVKTEEEAARFGGVAGRPYDSCYHTPCDTVINLNFDIFLQNAKAAAHAMQTFADRKVTGIFESSGKPRTSFHQPGKTVQPLREQYHDQYHKDRRRRPVR